MSKIQMADAGNQENLNNDNQSNINVVNENSDNNNNGNQMDNSAVQHIVAQGIIDAMPFIIQTVQEANNKSKHSSKRPTEPENSVNNGPILQAPVPKRRRTMPHGCSYKEF